jgi:pimeloyl-ACP methyl ester carboxylesterase
VSRRIAFLTLALAAFSTFAQATTHPEQGFYRLEDGTSVAISWLPEIESLIFTRFPSARLGALRAAGGELVAGPSIGAQEPVAFRAKVDGDAIRWQEGKTVLRGKRLPFRETEVTFRNGPVTLAGTLTLPLTKPPHPAVVFLHGGGAQTRNFLWLPAFFASHGVAVLAFDKRGSGASTGDWRPANARDLAGDGLAGVELLRNTPGIDKRRIGLYGSSNGGWVAPLAATIAPEKIAFVIARSASGLPERRNIIYEIESDLLGHGMAADVPKMKALHEQDIALLKDPSHWNDVRGAIERASTEPWFQYSRLPHPLMELNDANRARIDEWLAEQRAAWLEPPEVWKRVRCPVLVQNGDADESVSGVESVRIIRGALRGNRRATVVLYPNGTHAIFESKGERPPDFRSIQRYVPAYPADLGKWLDGNVSRR